MVRVDTVPVLLKPFFWLYGWGLGLYLYIFSKFTGTSCKVVFEGTPLNNYPNYVLCIWHDSLVSYFAVFNKVEKQVWMNHPAWFMKPVHVLLKLSGVEHICLGSSGNSGKQALAGVIDYLKQGYSTLVACDGPAGPNHVLKPGVLLMSRDAQIPIIPLRFVCSKSFRLGRWDRKFVPLPFSTIIVQAGTAIYVTYDNLQECDDKVTEWLNG